MVGQIGWVQKAGLVKACRWVLGTVAMARVWGKSPHELVEELVEEQDAWSIQRPNRHI